MKTFNKLSPLGKFLVLLGFNALFFVVCACILPLRFETNDDIAMCLIASGAYSGVPDAHLTHINYIYGSVLTFFYNTFPGLEWYTLLFCVFHIFALSVIDWKILKSAQSRWLKGAFILLLCVIEIRIILTFQFTTTAALCSLAGLLLLFEKKRLLQGLGVLVFYLGSLIRFDPAMCVMLLMLPVFMYEIIGGGGTTKKVVDVTGFMYEIIQEKSRLKIMFLVSLCIGGSCILKMADTQIYHNDEAWAYYKEYVDIIAIRTADKLTGEIVKDLPEEISSNDHALFFGFFATDEVIDLAKLKKMDSLLQGISLQKRLHTLFTRTGYGALLHYTWVLGLMACLFLLVKHRNKKLAIAYFLFFIVILAYSAWDKMLNYRAFISGLLPALFFLYYSIETFSIKNIKNKGFIGVVVLFSFLWLYATQMRRDATSGYEEMAAKEKEIIAKIEQENPIVVGFPSVQNPFAIKKEFSTFRFRGLGWMANSPLNKGTLDTYLSLLNADTYWLLSQGGEEPIVSMVQEALVAHYGVHTEAIRQLETEHFVLLQLKEIKEQY